MKRITLKSVTTEAKLLLIGIPVLLWTLLPIYHLVLFALSPKDSATTGKLWPDHPTLQNFDFVFHQKHFYLDHFWVQMGNSLLIALAVGALTLLIATCAARGIRCCCGSAPRSSRAWRWATASASSRRSWPPTRCWSTPLLLPLLTSEPWSSRVHTTRPVSTHTGYLPPSKHTSSHRFNTRSPADRALPRAFSRTERHW